MFPPRLRHAVAPAVLALVLAASAACEGRERGASDAPPAAAKVDSALPIAVLLERFRATVSDSPAVLGGHATSPEMLARDLLTALAAHDTVAVRGLAISKPEFAWLYYPHTRNVAPPYELGPELVWLTLVASSDKGASRLLARYGGQRLRFDRITCADSVIAEGPNTIVPGCRVRFAVADSAPREMRLFGALLKRGDRYKFLTYANDL